MAVRRVPVFIPRRLLPSHARPLTSLASRAPARGLATAKAPASLFTSLDTFADRHIGPEDHEVNQMLKQLGYESIEAFIADTVPPKIRVPENDISNESIPSLTETELFNRARELASANKPVKSYIGMGYHNAVVPPVILRNVCYLREFVFFSWTALTYRLRQIMESPAWYTPYTPYQPEIAQGLFHYARCLNSIHAKLNTRR